MLDLLKFFSYAVHIARYEPLLVPKLTGPPATLFSRLQFYGPAVEEKFSQLCEKRQILINESGSGVQHIDRMLSELTVDDVTHEKLQRAMDRSKHKPGTLLQTKSRMRKESLARSPRRRNRDPLAGMAIDQQPHKHHCKGPKGTWCKTCFTIRQPRVRGHLRRRNETK